MHGANAKTCDHGAHKLATANMPTAKSAKRNVKLERGRVYGLLHFYGARPVPPFNSAKSSAEEVGGVDAGNTNSRGRKQWIEILWRTDKHPKDPA